MKGAEYMGPPGQEFEYSDQTMIIMAGMVYPSAMLRLEDSV